MKRIYMDISDESHEKFVALAKGQKRTLKGFLENIIDQATTMNVLKSLNKKGVKKIRKND